MNDAETVRMKKRHSELLTQRQEGSDNDSGIVGTGSELISKATKLMQNIVLKI